MFVVYAQVGKVRHWIAEFDTEDEAIDFCNMWNWEMIDDNTLVWDLDYYER